MDLTTAAIRRAAATDLARVYEFELAYIREIEPQQEERWRAAIGGLLRQWTGNLGRMWFAESAGRIIGYCFWEPGKESAVLSSIYVLPAERRHGWGRRLLARFEEDAVQCGHQQFSLGVQRTNPARFLYEQSGYELVEHDGDYRRYRKAAA